MKLGLGFNTTMLNPDNLRFARQAGVTHIVAHTSGYRRLGEDLPPGYTGDGTIWSYEELVAMRKMVNAEGLELEALENFNPAFWYDILLDGPRKHEQMENLMTLIRNVGKAGIPVFGYNFSLAGVWGRVNGPYARGGAMGPAFLAPEEPPIPNGMVWNMVYDPNAPEGTVAPVSHAELWERAEYFLKNILPVAEEAGVVMAAHPDDPPMPTLRGTARLVYQPRFYQKLFDLVPSRNNQAEFCVGTLAEMSEGDIYETVETYAAMKKVAYVHLRNVRGKVPNYYEVFIDEGDTDILKVLHILARNDYQGVIIPDHAPQMNCPAPWHAGMAFALGYLRAGISMATAG